MLDMDINYEDVLKSIGELGLYQKLLISALICYPLMHSINTSVWNFIGSYHDHWCLVRPLQQFAYHQQKYIAIPYANDDSTEFNSCQMFDLNWANYSVHDFENWNRSAVAENSTTIQCENWVFDSDAFESTLSSQVNKHVILNFIFCMGWYL